MAALIQTSLHSNSRRWRTALWCFAGVLLLLLLAHGALLLSRSRTFQFFGGIVNRVDTSDKVVALTIDDGPTPGLTEELLAVLHRHDARATFFLTGADMERHPELARSIAIAGHQIGNHSFSHHRMVLKSPAFIRQEVDQTSRIIRAVGYSGPMMFRPPYGKKLLYLPLYLRTQRIPTIMWDIEPDSYDSIAGSTDRIVTHVLGRVKPGSIILLHAMNRQPSFDAVEPLLAQLGQQGYRFVTISELLHAGPTHLLPEPGG